MSPGPTSSSAQPTSSYSTSNISFHLSDTSTCPLLSTSHSNRSSAALTSLTSTYLTAHDLLARNGFGAPVRITTRLENGACMLQGCVPGMSTGSGAGSEAGVQQTMLNLNSNKETNSIIGRQHDGRGDEGAEGNAVDQPPPSLVYTIIAHEREQVKGVEQVAQRMKRVGRAWQEEWRRDQKGGNREDRDERPPEGESG